MRRVKFSSEKDYFQDKMASDKNNGSSSSGGNIEDPVDISMISLQENKEIDCQKVEEWLDVHPDFVHEYFSRKASRSTVDAWLISNAFSGVGGAAASHLPQHQHTKDGDNNANNSGSNSKTSSGANTPVRKISAQEFERGGQILKPMVSTVDGTPTFLGSLVSASGSDHILFSKGPRKSVSELKALDERELMYELVIDICNDLDVTSLCHKILQNVCLLVNADRCSLFLVQGEGESKHLVSKLFDVTSQATLQDCMTENNGAEVRVPWGSGIVGHVAQSGCPLNIPEAYQGRHIPLIAMDAHLISKSGRKLRGIGFPKNEAGK